MDLQRRRVAVVIPCYKVEKQIEKVIKSLPLNIDYIIAVNDCSPDNTLRTLERLMKSEKRLICINSSVNSGVGGAMIKGFKHAMTLDCDIVIKLDGDGQMDPFYIPGLIKPIVFGKADFVKGNRFRNYRTLKNMPFVRRFGNLGLSFLTKAASGYWNIFDPTNGYFAVSVECLRLIDTDKLHGRYFFESSMLIELYHVDAVISDLAMDSRYGDEVSNLSIRKTLLEFPPKLIRAWLKRILFKYFLYDFNVASLFIICGLPLLFGGLWFGVSNFIHYAAIDKPAPTGTVVIPTLMITLGFQLMLSAINYDINNYPKK